MLETGKYYKCIKTLRNVEGFVLFIEGKGYEALNRFELLNELGEPTALKHSHPATKEYFEIEPIRNSRPDIDIEHPSPYRLEPHKHDAMKGMNTVRSTPEHVQKEEQELLDSFAKIALGKLMERCSYTEFLNVKGVNSLTAAAYAIAESMMKSRGKIKY